MPLVPEGGGGTAAGCPEEVSVWTLLAVMSFPPKQKHETC